ncbi:MAG TPA: carboxypeptidase regulatory-like domain-containing protein [Gemmatimonadales bacterium]
MASRGSISLRPAVCGVLAVGLLSRSLPAQGATGKLEGRVQDEAGAPIAQAQLHMVGTAFAAVTDPRGRYFINNVPAGPWSVRAAYIGHAPVEVRGLRILAGQTITQDFTLSAAPLQLQEIRVVAAENPLVPRDEVTTKQRIDGHFADALPVDRIEQVLALQPGVIEANETILSGGGKDTPAGLSIRGGRPTQNVTYVDGVPVQPGYKGDRMFGFLELGSRGSNLSLGTNAIEEASVTSGSPSAEFGNATAGVAMAARSASRATSRSV